MGPGPYQVPPLSLYSASYVGGKKDKNRKERNVLLVVVPVVCGEVAVVVGPLVLCGERSV